MIKIRIKCTLLFLAMTTMTIFLWAIIDLNSIYAISLILTDMTIILFIWLERKIVKGEVEDIYVCPIDFPERKVQVSLEDKVKVSNIIQNETVGPDLQTNLKYEPQILEICTKNKRKVLKVCYNEEGEFLIKTGRCYYLAGLSKEEEDAILNVLKKYSEYN